MQKKFEKMGLKLNVAKCVVGIIVKFCTSINISLLYNHVLPWSEGLCYLGVVFRAGINLSEDISVKSQKLIGSVTSALKERVFGAVKKTKCMSFLFYGVDCLRVDAYVMEKLSII